MKKLSIALVALMLFCMMPVFGAFADESSDVLTISTADEYLEFVNAVNSATYFGPSTIEVTADLDMTGKDYVPLNRLDLKTLDFQGHALIGVNYTNEAAGNDAGIITNAMTEAVIKNVVLKDCTMTVKREGNDVFFGGIVGWCNRSVVTDITLENVTLNSEAAGEFGGVGGVIGAKDGHPSGDLSGEMNNIVLKNVTLNAPNSDASLVINRLGAADVTMNNVQATDVTITSTTLLDPSSINNVVCVEGNGVSLATDLTVYGSSVSATLNDVELSATAPDAPTGPETTDPGAAATTAPTTTPTPVTTKAPTTTTAPTTTAPTTTDDAGDSSSPVVPIIIVVAVVAVVAVVVVVIVKKKNG